MTHGVTGDEHPGTDSGIESGESKTEQRDLTKFQLRCLAVVAEDYQYGLGIKEELEDYYGEDVNHGRLYPNLDTLVDRGLVEKGQLDRRTNSYEATAKGRRVLETELGWLEERINGGE